MARWVIGGGRVFVYVYCYDIGEIVNIKCDTVCTRLKSRVAVRCCAKVKREDDADVIALIPI